MNRVPNGRPGLPPPPPKPKPNYVVVDERFLTNVADEDAPTMDNETLLDMLEHAAAEGNEDAAAAGAALGSSPGASEGVSDDFDMMRTYGASDDLMTPQIGGNTDGRYVVPQQPATPVVDSRAMTPVARAAAAHGNGAPPPRYVITPTAAATNGQAPRHQAAGASNLKNLEDTCDMDVLEADDAPGRQESLYRQQFGLLMVTVCLFLCLMFMIAVLLIVF